MPKVTVTQAFHFAKGGKTVRITKGDHDTLSADVIAHGVKLGFIPQPKPAKPQSAPQQPAAAESDKN